MARVLHVFEPPDGGVAQAVAQLAQGLGAHGYEVEVAGPRAAAPYAALAFLEVPVHRLAFARGYDAPHRDARALAQLVQVLQGGRFDLVHCHAAKAGALGRIAGRLVGVPVLYSPHCLPFVGDVSSPRTRVSLALERALGPLTAALVCVCEAERRVATDHALVRAGRATVVRNGARTDIDRADVDERLLRLRGDGLLVGAVTVLREQKGLPDLLRAAPRILAAVPQARIAIVGDGPEREGLELQAAALGLADDPRFALLPYEGPSARHLRALDLYVLPSWWEALPIGALEAMACGVAQVATDVGGTGEAVTGATGRLVAAHDPRALAGAVVDLLRDDAGRRARALASPRAHAERFTVERMVGETASLYTRVLSAAASTGRGRRASA